MNKTVVGLVVFVVFAALQGSARGESTREYKNKFLLMLDHAVHVNDYVRQRLGDKSLALYAHAMAETNATAAEKMTPPTKYAMLHPHFLLVLENIERSFYFAHKRDLANKISKWTSYVGRPSVPILLKQPQQQALQPLTLQVWTPISKLSRQNASTAR